MKTTIRTIRTIRWTASNTTSGTVLAVRTAQGWTTADGLVYGCGPTPTLFGQPPRPVSPRVLARVRRELGAAGGAS